MSDRELDIRWQQRLSNLASACRLLVEIDEYDESSTPAIVREGFVQRFEITFDLAWKTLKDYLDYQGIPVQPTPRAVIKEAFAVGVIENGEQFIQMLETRNVMSHRYDEEAFNEAFSLIRHGYAGILSELVDNLQSMAQ
ncbi:MAG: nucleotidyltransferase substrate binding protein [Promicromonosporaceae bacterium]|nr:nucleotidyltransferase substrate binding protein [Promicromonosporaceae bacterium]